MAIDTGSIPGPALSGNNVDGMESPTAHNGGAEDLDIVVVGAGLTGLFLTHLLLEVYHIDPSRIVLLERQPKRYDLPRAAGFSDDNARLYRTCMAKNAVDSAVQKIVRPVCHA